MRLNKLFGILAASVLLLGPTLRAVDCVNVDIELTPEVKAGEIGRGNFELTNCGDTAGSIVLSFVLQIPDGPTIEVADIPITLGAGETVSHAFSYPALPFFVGYSFGLCVTAAMGATSVNDCASTTIVAGAGPAGPTRDNFGVALALGDDCLEIDLEITDVIYTSPGDFLAEAYFELTNCGDNGADVDLKLDVRGYDLSGSTAQPVHVGAGETISRQWTFVVPPYIPDGVYVICVTASAGTALVTECETVEVVSTPPPAGANLPLDSVYNYPNPFNPSTRISFSLKEDTPVSVSVFNLLGQQVRTIIDGQTLSAGEQEVVWDGRDDSGQPVASGIYFYRIVTNNQTVSEKMVLVK